ncbi:MAG: hypothetical protein COB39_05505 [Marinosulfonomonas sp.]|nr:MAG: hypothetical protein COB39_05505 [Marinosulfonomonas sp.]
MYVERSKWHYSVTTIILVALAILAISAIEPTFELRSADFFLGLPSWFFVVAPFSMWWLRYRFLPLKTPYPIPEEKTEYKK